MYYDVIEVKPLDNLALSVRFADGLEGLVRFEPTHLYGVFEQLKQPDIFRQVRCDGGFVAWPGDIDLAPDAMYDEIKSHGLWVLRRTFELPINSPPPASATSHNATRCL